jgi:uncharacterized protein (TIGR00725 family)
MRRPVVGVMGSSTVAHTDRAEPLGKWLAEIGVHLLTGGGGASMEAVCRAFATTPGREGLVLGVLPGLPVPHSPRPQPPSGYPNPYVDIGIYTHLGALGEYGSDPMSRNHINVLSSDVVIALPGSSGTASEVELALHYGKPVIAFVHAPDEIEGLPSQTRMESDFGRLQEFVRQHLPALPAV